jgi:hypothetical protein
MGTALQSSGRGGLVTVGRKATGGCGLLRLWLRACSILVVKNQEGKGCYVMRSMSVGKMEVPLITSTNQTSTLR